MVVKIVHDELVKLLGGEGSELNLNAVPPACILMVGLQGSGKTTTSAKIANRLKNKKESHAGFVGHLSSGRAGTAGAAG